MLKALIKKQLLELFQTYFVNRKTGKARTKKSVIGMFVLMALLFVFLGAVFFAMAMGLGTAVLGTDKNWLFFALMGLMSMAMGVFGSVFNTYAALYLPKDTEILMSLPIPEFKLVLARCSGVFCTSFMYSALVWIPTLIVYMILVPAGVLSIVFSIVMTFVIALFVSVLSCALGWVVALIASKAKNKSFLTVFISLVFIIGYWLVYGKLVNSLGVILAKLDLIGEKLSANLRYIYAMGRACDGDAAAMLKVTGITLALGAICLYILSRTFGRLTAAGPKSSGRAAKAEHVRKSSAKRAMITREFRHFSSVPTWMLNGGLGLILLPAGAIYAAVKSGVIRDTMTGLNLVIPNIIADIPIFLIAIVCIIVSMDCILSVSVSLEGKNIWILRTLPVSTRDILSAKESMNFILNAGPIIFTVILAGIVLKLGIIDILLVLCASILYVILCGGFGLMLNLRHPNLIWTNPTLVIKQSPSVVICMFGGWAFNILVAAGGFFLAKLIPVTLVCAAVCVFFASLALIIRKWLYTRGCAVLDNL